MGKTGENIHFLLVIPAKYKTAWSVTIITCCQCVNALIIGKNYHVIIS